MRLRILLPVLAVLVGEVAAAPPVPGQDAARTASSAAQEPKTAGEDAVEVEWLTDEDGKRYRIEELEKGIEDRDWAWVGENRIRIRYGMNYEVVSHDEESFRIKVYERTRPPQLTPEERQQQREALEREKEQRLQEVAETYRVDLETVDRLTFESFDRGLPRQGQWRNGFDVADMNGDGHLDIVFGAARKTYPGRPNIFLGDGAGGWGLWRQARYPRQFFDYGDAAVADFNRDGHLDLALGIHLSGVLVLVGDGEGRFELWSEGIGFEVPGKGGPAGVFSSRALEVADWDGDGWTDLLALGEGPKGVDQSKIVVAKEKLKSANGPVFFLNAGDGSWRPRGSESKIFGDSLALGDFNGDGRLDFATASNSYARGILNLGTEDGGWEASTVHVLRPKSYQRAVAGGRLNGDEIDDLVVGYLSNELGVWRTGVDVLYGAGDLDWQRRPLYSDEGKRGIYSLATGDLDGDGRRDVAFANGNGEVFVYLADEAGFFARENAPELPEKVPGCRGYGMRISDLDGDGRGELIVSFAGERAAMMGLAASATLGCPQEGSLRVWSSRPRAAEEQRKAR